MTERILKIEDILQNPDDSPGKRKSSKVKKKPNEIIPRGTPKSGRTWKSQKNRFSSIIKTRGLKKANKFEKLQALKKDLSRVRELTNDLKEKHQQKLEQKKERRRRNLKRQEENRLKSEVVQVITNSSKLKRMKKKQLRNVEKRDTLNKK